MPKLVTGYVKQILKEWSGAQIVQVALADEPEAQAYCYPALTGPCSPGDTVLVNVVAVELGLGTGGYHFVVANLSNPEWDSPQSGRVMKLRYTPHQINVASVEEEDSPLRPSLLANPELKGLIVLLCPLHSFLAPACAGIKKKKPNAKIAYVMTDSAALSLSFSQLVTDLKEAGLLDLTITCGQAYGGDLEAVNCYTGLLAARVTECDVAIVASGPGHLGTGTPLGFAGVEMAWILDAVNILKGRPFFAPRISFADPRIRHQGISHHTITVLTVLCHSSATVVFPILQDRYQRVLEGQLKYSGIAQKHTVVWEDGQPAIDLLTERGVPLESMGRSFEKDPALFLAPAACALYAARLL
ncbi:MAG: DUF3866 family protein [Armatimonadetes bacterium]|nr:DUF3866 family protein [Armatimonadota bacterium]MDW8122173.1 DUF3866 family protein [Armatimonadota bacterium]